MSEPRLSTSIEVGGFLRAAEAAGGFGTILHRGDEERGSLLLLVAERGVPVAILERQLTLANAYQWAVAGPKSGDSQQVTSYMAKRRQSDPDCWAVELDIPHSERFIAETTGEG